MALNLTVKSANLTESLDQFVRGELLEGDNAYYCEKCNAKRSAVKRMSIRKLPKTLVIQLKRFHYDHETNRAVKFDDYFEFPRNLEMSPYTTEGIRQAEKSDKMGNSIGEKRTRTLSTSSLSASSSSKKSSFKQLNKQNYDLVGVVVHSGQASAGHYYSFIKDRQTEKWLKFNDTSVEEFQMTDDSIIQECFGGNFKVKKNPGSSLPENRQRYWNAYMLFYQKRGSQSAASAVTPETRGGSVRSLTLSTTPLSKASSTRKTSMPVQPQQTHGGPRESLSQLSDLLEKGEKRGIFAHSSSMPTSIEQNIHDENQRFILNRDVFCQDYYSFVCDLLGANASSRAAIAKDEGIALQSVKLAVYFMLNSYAHTKKRQKHLLSEVMDMVESYLQKSSKTCQWMIEFLGTHDQGGICYMRPFLLECGAKEVRTLFSQLLIQALRFQKLHFCTTKVGAVENILSAIYGLIKDDVAKHIKNSAQLFLVLSKFAQEGLSQCQQLLETGFFAAIVKLLIGLDIDEESPDKINNRQRKWAPSQNRELGELHVTLATLVLACDTSSYQDAKNIDTAGPNGKFFFKVSFNRRKTAPF